MKGALYRTRKTKQHKNCEIDELIPKATVHVRISALHEAAFSESIRLSVEVSRLPFQNIQIRNISLKNMSDIGGGLFFNDAALNVMIYTYVFFFSGEGRANLQLRMGMGGYKLLTSIRAVVMSFKEWSQKLLVKACFFFSV